MATRPEIADPAVDELKRRARRRLVGAVVLALAAAVVLPMLLESDPKPLGNDVSIQIPPIDQGKFVTPLSPDKAGGVKSAGESQPAAPQANSAGRATVPERRLSAAEQRVLGQSGAPRAPAIMSSAPEAMRPQAPPAVSAPSGAAAAGTESAPAGGSLFVQVAALADSKAAEELAAKLAAAGFPAHVEPVETRQGPVQRVRVGAYASREAAEVALSNIKAAGYGSAIVTSQ
ncbi:MAG TPA: SPOR domain-containing protein [Casimicrobiaceae bacterium]|jgi:DedD protein